MVSEVAGIIIISVIIASLASIFFAELIISNIQNAEITISTSNYESLSNIYNISLSSTYSCSSELSQVSVSSSGIISIDSPIAVQKSVAYIGGSETKGEIYYSSGELFMVSPYSISPGNYSDVKICAVPSSVDPIYIIIPIG
jgi:hypothetical protein